MLSTNSGSVPRTATKSPAASRAEVTLASGKRITECAEVLLRCQRRAECPPAGRARLPVEESGGGENGNDAGRDPHRAESAPIRLEGDGRCDRLPLDGERREE